MNRNRSLECICISILVFLFPFFILAQHTDSIGWDDHASVNRQEAALLNTLCQDSGNTFDFTGKKIGFATGSTGNRLVLKSEFFRQYINPWLLKEEHPQVRVVVFSQEDKHRSGGYDAIVFAWTKWFTKRQKSKAIKRLARQ